jgi:hypothetical protein
MPTHQSVAEVTIRNEGTECVTEFAGDEYEDHNDLILELRRAGARRIQIIAAMDVPYRCVGGLVFGLQRSKFNVTVVAEPPPT